MQESAYGPDKTHNSYTGRLSYGSPAVHDTARSEAVKAMQSLLAEFIVHPKKPDGVQQTSQQLFVLNPIRAPESVRQTHHHFLFPGKSKK